MVAAATGQDSKWTEPRVNLDAREALAWLRYEGDMGDTEPGVRMTRMEEEVREHGRILIEIRTSIATMTEQMKQALALIAAVRGVEQRQDTLDRDLAALRQEVRENTMLRNRISGLTWKVTTAALLGGGAVGAAAAKLLGG